MIWSHFSAVSVLNFLLILVFGSAANSGPVSLPTPGSGPGSDLQGQLSKSEEGLPKRLIRLKGQVLSLEIADEDHEHQRGLMFRQSLEANSGMLFLFPSAQPRTFWMKNTFIPLDIGFFDSQRRLINFESMDPVRSESEEPKRNYLSKGPAQFVIELKSGWFRRHQVKKGDAFEFVKNR